MKLDAIDLHNNLLTIEKAKFGKSRLVPIHPSTRKVLVKYLQRRKRFLEGCDSRYVFTSGTGNRLDKADVHRTFYEAALRSDRFVRFTLFTDAICLSWR